MKISVIVPVYNQARMLRLVLRALTAEPAPVPYEILVCEDGSADGAPEVVREFSGRTEIRYLWQSRRGARRAANRNNGIRCAQGDLLVFLDGDVIPPPHYLASHLAQHDGSPRVVCGSRRYVRDHAIEQILSAEGLPYELLEASSYCGNRRGQLRQIQSPHPWMAFCSCDFSVPKHPEILFDPRFEGWGWEDMEVGFRLYHLHNFKLIVPEMPESYHLGTNEARVMSHQELISSICNALYFRYRYPNLDVTPILEPLRVCYLDSETGEWRVAPKPVHSLPDILNLAETWMESHGIEYRP